MGIGIEYLLFQRGPMTMAPSQLGAFAKSDPSYDTPNIQYHVQPLTLDKFGEPLHTFPAFTASVCNLRPESRGTIRLKSANPYDSPSIRPNYLSAERDKQVAAQAVRYTRNIVNQPALAKYKPQEFKPGLELETQEDLVKAAGDISSTIFHPIGTCKMGDDPMAVVDGRLRVHGLRGLRVVDASIMPTITSGKHELPDPHDRGKGLRDDKGRPLTTTGMNIGAAVADEPGTNRYGRKRRSKIMTLKRGSTLLLTILRGPVVGNTDMSIGTCTAIGRLAECARYWPNAAARALRQSR